MHYTESESTDKNNCDNSDKDNSDKDNSDKDNSDNLLSPWREYSSYTLKEKQANVTPLSTRTNKKTHYTKKTIDGKEIHLVKSERMLVETNDGVMRNPCDYLSMRQVCDTRDYCFCTKPKSHCNAQWVENEDYEDKHGEFMCEAWTASDCKTSSSANCVQHYGKETESNLLLKMSKLKYWNKEKKYTNKN